MDPRPPAARLAEHTFLQYQRLLQREVSEPELVIQLPNVLGDYGTMLSESADVAGVEFMELKVIIAFEALRPRCGMHFCGDWALSDNEVGGGGKQCRLGLPACHGVGRLHSAALCSSQVATWPARLPWCGALTLSDALQQPGGLLCWRFCSHHSRPAVAGKSSS